MRCAAPLALLLASACGGLGESGPQEDLSRTANAVVSGSPAPDDAAVVALVARRTRCAGEIPTLLCTGALIAPDVVLTAAHCLDVFGVDGQYEIFVGDRLPSPTSGRFLRVTDARVHPGYVRGAHDWDVALLRLASPADVMPLPLPTPDELPTTGLALRVLGYGDTRDATEPAGVRRQGTLEVASVDAATFRAIPAPSMSCTGDSGGPVLGSPQGREVLLGVTVSGDFACRSEAVQVRVDAVLEDFVRPFVSAAAPSASVSLPPAQLCAQSCESSVQCPAGLACVEDPAGVRHCMLLALREGDFTEACTDDAACGAGGTCARLESEGEDACRCFTACAPEPPEATGCAAAGGAAAGPAELLLAALLARRPRGSGRKRGEATAHASPEAERVRLRRPGPCGTSSSGH